ncbi:MAG TPA: hypothetical protein VFL36_16935 [Myxococcales bacterium]|nr:hypothetical protein [Myxococcales bacterium]
MLVPRWMVPAVLGPALAAGALLAHDVAPVGNAAIGRALYTGAVALEKGGAPCVDCHALGGQGPALNASFGPDLSRSQAALDGDILDGVLTDMPYASMKPLYAGRPISETERAHLAAFFQEAAGKAPAGGGGWFAAEAVLLAGCIGILFASTRRRRPSPREQLRDNARRIGGLR